MINENSFMLLEQFKHTSNNNERNHENNVQVHAEDVSSLKPCRYEIDDMFKTNKYYKQFEETSLNVFRSKYSLNRVRSSSCSS